MRRRLPLILFLVLPALGTDLTYSPAPLDNPLKGIAANWSVTGGALASFPHSLNTQGFAVNALMSGPTNFDWTTFDNALNTTTNDGSQLIPLFYIDYPSATTNSQVPDYVLTNGLQTWVYTFEGHWGQFPDYSNTNLQQCLSDFITALGARYDGDPRIAFIRLGIVGVYGEWHWGPSDMQPHWPTVTVQRMVMDAYTNAFRTTKLMIRYPVGSSDLLEGVVPMPSNYNYPLGYHDDSFCRTTVPTNWPVNQTNPAWFQMSEMVVAGATNQWKKYPMGGELSSSLYVKAFSNSPVICPTNFGIDQTWSNTVCVTHSTWIHQWAAFYEIHLYGGGSYDFGPGGTNAMLGTRELGYELWAKSWTSTVANEPLCTVTMTNTGVAPFYYDWQMQVAAATNGAIAKTWNTSWKLTDVVPGDGDVNWNVTLTNPPSGTFTLLMRAVNPMANGKVLRFANATQHSTITNWLTLGDVTAGQAKNLRGKHGISGKFKLE